MKKWIYPAGLVLIAIACGQSPDAEKQGTETDSVTVDLETRELQQEAEDLNADADELLNSLKEE